MTIDTLILSEYRKAIEQAYCITLVDLIRVKQEQIDLEQFVTQGLAKEVQDVLTNRFGRYRFDETAEVMKREVCHCLLYYMQLALHIRDQKIALVGRTILEREQLRLGLMQASVDAINQAILPALTLPVEMDSAKLERYDAALQQAILQDCRLFDGTDRENIPLTAASQAELRLLQRWLEIPDSEIPPANRLWTERGTDYTKLWRQLKRKDWRAANEETLNLLRINSGKSERDSEMIDIQRIPLVDLQTIDQLWDEASNGRFGFRVQLDLWRQVNPDPRQPSDTETFGKLVDWRRNNVWINYEFLDYSLTAVRGHLPAFPLIGWWCWARHKPLMERVAALTAVRQIASTRPFEPHGLTAQVGCSTAG